MKGHSGITDTDLHPSGWIIINDKRIFVVSEGGYIEKGKKIEVLSVEGNRVTVRELIK